MEYSSNYFDIVILGWVLPYSLDQEKLISEVIRVSKQKSIISIGVDYDPQIFKSCNEQKKSLNYRSANEILDKFFKNHEVYLFFKNEPKDEFLEIKSNIILIFELSKNNECLKETLYNRYKEFINNKQYIKARTELESLLKIDKYNADYIYNLAILEKELNNFEKSIELLSNILELGIVNYEICYQLASCLENIGDSDANYFYKKAEELRKKSK